MGQEWHLSRGGKQFGPFSVAELRQLAGSGKLRPDDLIRRAGTDSWVEARSMKGFLFSPAHGAEGATAPKTAPPMRQRMPAEEPEDELPILHGGEERLGRPFLMRVQSSLRQTFGDAVKHTLSNTLAAAGLLLKHPLRLSFLAVIFVLASGMALASVLGAVLFPVFVMGYITCIQAMVEREPVSLEGFLNFMRHGWDVFWHLLMMLAAFFVTVAAMLAPFIVTAMLLYFVLGSAGAAVGEAMSHSSGTGSRSSSGDSRYGQRGSRPTQRFDMDESGRPSGPSSATEGAVPSWLSRLAGEAAGKVLRLGLLLGFMATGIVLLAPLAAAGILFFYLALKVSRGNPSQGARFDLVYEAFREMLRMARFQWKELLMSGLAVSLCFIIGIVGVPGLLSELLLTFGLYMLAAWVYGGFVPFAACLFVVYASLFLTLTCLSLDKRAGKSEAAA